MRRSDLFVAVREHDAEAAMKCRCEECEQVARRGVGLMQILENEQDRTQRDGVLQQEVHRAKEALAALLVRHVLILSRRELELREQRS